MFYVRDAGTNDRQRWGDRSRKRGRCNDTHRLATGLRARATLSPVAHTMWLRYGG